MQSYETPRIPKSVFSSSTYKFLRGRFLVELLTNTVIPAALKQSAPSVDYKTVGDETVASLVNPPVPPEVSLITGEAIHNLRGALDHMTSAIVHFHTNKVSRSTFPVSMTKSKLLEEKNKSNSIYKILPGLWDFIYHEIRPYADEDGDSWISTLSRLHNTDKHRLLMTTFHQSIASDNVMSEHGAFMYNAVVNTGVGPFEFARFKGPLSISPRPIASTILLNEPEVGSVPLDQALAKMLETVHRVGMAIETQMCGAEAFGEQISNDI